MSAPLFTARDFCGLESFQKQNRLQMSQVFSVSVQQPSDGLAFPGFYKAGPLHPSHAASQPDHAIPGSRRSEARPR